MSPIQRVRAVLAGQKPDRMPFSFWHHFTPDHATGDKAVRAHLDWIESFGVDFLKVMNDNPYPQDSPIHSIADLNSLKRLSGSEDGFARQIELISSLRRAVGNTILLTTTIFNAWSVLRALIQPPREHHPPVMDPSLDQPSHWIRDAWQHDSRAVENALQTIGANLTNFARRCIAAGADGIFLSVRPDWVDTAEHPTLYRQMVRPIDLHILSGAAGGEFNILHICGRVSDLRPFNDFPAHALSWADRVAGPSIASVKDWLAPAMCCGLNNERTLPRGSAQAVKREVHDALRQAGDRPMLIAPDCTFDPAEVPRENLLAIREVLEESS